MASVLVVGEALVDVTASPTGTSTLPGGSPLNIAVGCARLDVSTVLACQLGDDDAGDLLRDHLDDSDVDVRSLPPHRTETSVARADVDAAGHATYTFDLAWDPAELPTPDEFDCVHVGSIGAALAPGADAVAELVERAAAAGVPVSFDPNVRPTITPDLADVRRRVEAIARHASVIKLSDEDAETLYPGETDVLGRLVGRGRTGLAAMTCGSRSVRLRSRAATATVAPPKIEVVDTIGAGDSFMAALLADLLDRSALDRDDLDEATLSAVATRAARAAAITCSRPGANPPTRQELEDAETGSDQTQP